MNKLNLLVLTASLLSGTAFASSAARIHEVSRPVVQAGAPRAGAVMKKAHRRTKLQKNRRSKVKPAAAKAGTEALHRLRAHRRGQRFLRPRRA